MVDSDRRAARIAGRWRLNIVVVLLLLLYNCSLGVSMNSVYQLSTRQLLDYRLLLLDLDGPIILQGC